MNVTLQQLRYFVAVAEERNFTRAAERVYLSQPALSQQVQRIEEVFGARLLERDKRSVALTAAGQTLLEHARRTLGEADALTRAVQSTANAAEPTLRIAYNDAANLPFIAPAVRDTRRRHPQTRTERLEIHPTAQLQALLERRIDLSIGPLPAPRAAAHAELEVLPLLKTHWVVMLPADHALASREQIALSALRAQPLVLVSATLNPPVFAGFVERCREQGFEPNVVFEAGHSASAVEFVREGVGLFIACSSTALRGRPSDVVVRPLVGFDSVTDVGAIWRRDHRSKVLSDFVAAARVAAVAWLSRQALEGSAQ